VELLRALRVARRGAHRVRLAGAIAAAIVIAASGGALWWGSAVFRDPLRQGLAAYDARDWTEAAARATERLRTAPSDRDALWLLARASARLERDEMAQHIFLQLGAKGATAEDFCLLGSTLVREGRDSQAVAILERAIEIDPKHTETLVELCRLYSQMDRLADATDLAERLVRQSAWTSRASVTLGRLYDEQNNPQSAALALERALRLDPLLRGATLDPPAARTLLARELLSTHNPAGALRLLGAPFAPDRLREAAWLRSRAAIQQGDREAALSAIEAAAGFASERPETFEPAPFVGSAACAECHAEVYQFEQTGRHARTFFPASDLRAIKLPDHALADPSDPDVVHTLGRAGDRVALKTRVKGQELEAFVEFVLGSGKHAHTPVGRDREGRIRELRLSFYAEIGGWDQSPGHAAHPDDPAGYLGELQTRDSLRRCLNCHTTNFRSALLGTGPESADRGIGCERCHGPGGNHVAAVELGLSEPAIGRFKGVSESRIMALCAQCHGTRGRHLPSGDPALVVRFQATTLTWSKCYRESREALGCLTCHSPHRDAGDRSAAFYESRCLACHGTQAEARKARPAPHAPVLPVGARLTVCPVNPAGQCLNCHMRPVKGAVPHTMFTDHQIRVIRP
jgi:tetratricopeptide (TPR) repeat protein